MKLFQYERFFNRYPNEEVQSKGKFLLGVIDQLEATLLVTSDWEKFPLAIGLTRMDQIKLQVYLQAMDRNGGSYFKAGKWLGITGETIRVSLKEWKKYLYPSNVILNKFGNKSEYEKPINDPVSFDGRLHSA